jgi:hypothetical protein
LLPPFLDALANLVLSLDLADEQARGRIKAARCHLPVLPLLAARSTVNLVIAQIWLFSVDIRLSQRQP